MGRIDPMNDQEFLEAFETCTLADFKHRDHIRMAWLYLRRDGWDDGMDAIRTGIQQFAAHLEVTQLYHETITYFWARVVFLAINSAPDIDSFDPFIRQHPHLLDKSIMSQHYSKDCIASVEARANPVEPDLRPLPEMQR
jgi:hypothetical protein